MKKIIIATAVALTMGSGAAMAAQQGEVQFFGNVSKVTCDIETEVAGSVNNVLQLGTVKNGGTGADADIGKEIPFALKLKAGSTCAGLVDSKNAVVSWSGPLTAEGIGNQGGLAVDAVVLLKTVNGGTGTQKLPVTSNTSSVEFIENKIETDGYQFTAQLKGGTEVGDFKSAAAFAVTYQ